MSSIPRSGQTRQPAQFLKRRRNPLRTAQREPHMTDPSAAAPLQVVLVCPRGEHLETVRHLARQWPRAARIHWTADPADALRHAQASAPALAIVDARIDRASGCALIDQLGNSHASIDILAFDDRGTPRACSHSTWHWPELSRAVTWWMQRHLQPASAVR
jgi:hypothetical protein